MSNILHYLNNANDCIFFDCHSIVICVHLKCNILPLLYALMRIIPIRCYYYIVCALLHIDIVIGNK